jgi:hypothetical protein
MAITTQNQKQAVIAEVIRRLAAFFIDMFVSLFILSLIIYIAAALFPTTILHQLENAATANPTSTSYVTLQIEFIFASVFTLAFYYFICLVAFSKTLGMIAMNLVYVTANSTGDPIPLDLGQKFVRGFIAGLLALFIIPIAALPFDQYRRSVVDRLAGSFVFQMDRGRVRTILAYVLVIALLFVYIFYTGT